MTMPPTTTPRNTIRIGSIRAVRPGEGRLDFLIEEVRDALEHVVDFAGLFAGGDHADNHAGKDRVLAERGGNALTAFDIQRGRSDGFLHNHIADGLGHDLQHLEDGHAAADQGGQGAGEARQADLVGDGRRRSGSLMR